MQADRSVLIVEDDEAVRLVLMQALESELGATAITGADGAAALARALRARPAVVVLDLMLPEVDGLEVARRLRADPPTATARIVAVSAMTPSAAVRERALAAGCDAFIAKPFRIDELLAVIRGYLAEPDREPGQVG